MTGLTRLTDIQLVLLATAVSRDNGSLLPPPETLGEGPARIRKAVQSLIRRGLAIESDLVADADAWRTEGDRAVGVMIADAGRAAIAVDPDEPASDVLAGGATSAPQTLSAETVPSPARTKTVMVLDLLRREAGATLNELIEATGWLPHTTRAALTGLRKKGHAIVRGKRDDVTYYTLDSGVAA
jgi:hypothetical protein